MSTRKTLLTLAAGLMVLLPMVGCSVDPQADIESGSTPAPDGANALSQLPDIEPQEALAAKVPESLRESGIVVATSGDTPPMNYFADDDVTLVGFDVDMSRAIGAVLDLETEVRDVGFDTIIPGLASDRFTMALASIGVTLERQEVVDFVSYYNGGQGFLAAATSDFEVAELEDLCGLRVAVGVGTVQQTTLEDSADLCADAGKDAFDLLPYPDLNQSVLAIKSDRADVLYGTISIIGYTAAQDDSFRIAGVYKRALVGVALPKDSEMVPLVQEAVQYLIDEGVYDEILAKWGLEENGIDQAEVNSATS